jgi:hypothetical protein
MNPASGGVRRGNAIRGNSIFHTRPVIDLTGLNFSGEGVSLNDRAMDVGTNNLQNFPVLTSASSSPAALPSQER